MPGNWGWNTIDHVADRRFGYDYGTAQITVMAGSEEWLALATKDQGLILLNKSSHVPRENITGNPILDVTGGPGRNDFLVLQNDQGISQVRPGHWPGTTSVQTWLPAPEQPFWPVTSPSDSLDIIASDLDRNGWLIAAKNAGIARYHFDRLPDGRVYRTRSWQTSSLSNIPLDQAVISQNGIWYTLQSGGIGYADRVSLQQVLTRSISSTLPIVRLDADYGDNWASAIDEQRGLWLYPGDKMGWAGPFLGATSGCQLHALADVSVVRWDAPVAWLGTTYGFFAYNSDARHMECVIPDIEVVDIATSETPRESSSDRRALIASNKGLSLVTATKLASTPAFQVASLDSNPIEAMHVSPDSGLLVYKVRVDSLGEQSTSEVRTLGTPFSGGAPATLIPGQGWSTTEETPTVVGIEQLKNGFLLATSVGAVFYDPETHTYEDRSMSMTAQDQEVRLNNFSNLQRVDTQLLAVADGTPQLLDVDNTNTKKWVNLDLPGYNRPIQQITRSKGKILGLGHESEIYWYQYPERDVASYLLGYAPSLIEHPMVALPVLGDLRIGDNQAWKTAFLHDESVITYDSETGSIEEKALALPIHDQDALTQIRFVSDNLLYLLKDGRVFDDKGDVKFASGSIPFPPDQTTALASGIDKDTVLLGGPSAQVIRYNWGFGSVNQVSSEPIPENNSLTKITEIQDTQYGTFVKLASNNVYQAWNQTWHTMSGYHRWAINKEETKAWFLGDEGLTQLTPQAGPADEWAQTLYSNGSGMKEFVSKAAFVWQIDDSSIAFLTHSPAIGIYNARTDMWDERSIAHLNSPRQFVATSDFLVVLDDQKVVRIDKNWALQSISILPATVQQASIYLNGTSLRLAFVDDQGVTLRIWDDLADVNSYHEYRRTGMTAPSGFALEQVVYAQSGGAYILLVDRSGNCAIYNFTTGQWQSLYQAKFGQTVYGWLPDVTGESVDLLLATKGEATHILHLRAGQIDAESALPMSAEALNISSLRQTATLCQGVKWLSMPYLPCITADWYTQMLKRLGREPTTLLRPENGTLLDTKTVKITRQNQKAVYEVAINAQWHTLSPQSHGFAEDNKITGAAFSASGYLWALQGKRLVKLMPMRDSNALVPDFTFVTLEQEGKALETLPTGHLRLHYKGGNSGLFQESSAGIKTTDDKFEQVQATLNFAGNKLEWIWAPERSIHAIWRDKPWPIWGTKGNGLAIQQIQDIALTPDGDLLVSTPLGLLVRDPAGFDLRSIYPDISNARFQHVYNPEQLFIQAEDNLSFTWQEGKPVPLSSRSAETITTSELTGPWRWQLTYSQKDKASLSVIHTEDHHRRSWVEVGPEQWRWGDDFVIWLHRGITDSLVTLATKDGMWLFDPVEGRPLHSVAVSQDTAEDEITLKNPALTIAYQKGQISFVPGDRSILPVFAQGRFFFDNGEQMVNYQDSLYFLVPGRGIVRRNPQRIGEITGFWSLPTDLIEKTHFTMEESSRGVRLVTRLSNESRIQVWELDLSNNVGQWRHRENREEPLVAEFGPTIWRRQYGDQVSIVPFLVLGSGAPQKLSQWWSGERFVWDKVACVGALKENMTILATPVGSLILQIQRNRTVNTMLLGPILDTDYCATARNETHSIGLLVGQVRSSVRFLITVSPEGVPILKVQRKPADLLYHAALNIGYQNSYGHRIIGMSQTWVPTNQGEVSRDRDSLQSHLPEFRTQDLLKNGQFIFDQADGASPININNGTNIVHPFWINYLDCPDTNESICMISLNELQTDNEVKKFRLVLRDVWKVPVGFQAMRPTSNGGIFGLRKTNSGNSLSWNVVRSNFSTQGVTWDPIKREDASEAFRIGTNVTIDIKNLQWITETAYLWNSSGPPAILPSNYNLFVYQPEGVALAPDIMTSLALDRKAQRLIVGTQGGVLISPYTPDGNTVLALSPPEPFLILDQFNNSSSWSPEVQRVRYDENGQLWIWFGAAGQVAKQTHEATWELMTQSWPNEFGRVKDIVVNIGGQGFTAHGKRYRSSNDAWWISQRSIDNIVDFAFDDKTNTLWLATQQNGVFKALPNKLR